MGFETLSNTNSAKTQAIRSRQLCFIYVRTYSTPRLHLHFPPLFFHLLFTSTFFCFQARDILPARYSLNSFSGCGIFSCFFSPIFHENANTSCFSASMFVIFLDVSQTGVGWKSRMSTTLRYRKKAALNLNRMYMCMYICLVP